MTYFITGIAGFIGYHLAMRLKTRDNHVIGCDNFNTYYDPQLKRKRADLLQQSGINVIEMDINHKERLETLLKEYSVTHLIHLAAQAGCRNCSEHLESYLNSNLLGFVHVLEACKAIPNIRLTFASSSSVYGLNTKVPFSETDSTEHPTSLYAATKKADELLAFTYHHLYQIPITGLRFFTVYGPWGRPDMAYFSFTRKILNDEPITLFNNGNMQRDFTYVDDIINGTVAAIDLGANWEIFNLGNNRPESVLNLVSLIEQKTGKVAKKQLKPKQAEEVEMTYADITKARTHLNYAPNTTLSEGMDHFLHWYKSHHLYN